MRAVVQRVAEARVLVNDEVVGAIGRGVAVLLGVGWSDTGRDAEYLAGKIAELRIFEDEAGKMNRSLLEVGGQALIISQFTLLGDCRKGRRPSFTQAAPPETAEKLYLEFVNRIAARGVAAATGRFGALMQVHLVNDGPVTLILDTAHER
ncbi:MAG: D-aminoacyl-tRNA deacylase [Thermodesulfobacteriota bacterium]